MHVPTAGCDLRRRGPHVLRVAFRGRKTLGSRSIDNRTVVIGAVAVVVDACDRIERSGRGELGKVPEVILQGKF